MRDQNYLALDLELNNKSDGSTPKIIEVGVAIGNPTRPCEITKLNWYLDPHEPVNPFIENLTGISDSLIREKAVPHEQVAKELGALFKVYDCFPNPITWGQGDADELKQEFREREIVFPHFGRRIFDVKTIYVFKQLALGNTVSGGLKKVLGRYGLKFEGKPHRAGDDAYNTLRLFFQLLHQESSLRGCLQELKQL
jgi:inhibitor of KinA sporulation pathway (predicted exonuclease)